MRTMQLPQPPQPAPHLTPLEGAEAGTRLYSLAAADSEIETLHLKSADLSGEDLTSSVFSHCTLENCRFPAAVLQRAAFTDCTFRSCDFSSADLTDAYFSRCVFRGCKLLGANLTGASLHNTDYTDSNLRMAVWETAAFDRVRFAECTMVGAMLTHTKHKSLIFTDTDLSGACFTGTMLRGTDLRGCALADVSAGEYLNEFRGAVVDVEGAVSLAALLGVDIR